MHPLWAGHSLLSGRPLERAPLTEFIELSGSITGGRAGAVMPEVHSIDVWPEAHEARLLREPWTSTGAPACKSRPCLFGKQCVGMRGIIPGCADCGGFVLTEAMSVSDYEEFERTGAPPVTRMPCVLCTRANVMDAYLYMRRMSGPQAAHAAA